MGNRRVCLELGGVREAAKECQLIKTLGQIRFQLWINFMQRKKFVLFFLGGGSGGSVCLHVFVCVFAWFVCVCVICLFVFLVSSSPPLSFFPSVFFSPPFDLLPPLPLIRKNYPPPMREKPAPAGDIARSGRVICYCCGAAVMAGWLMGSAPSPLTL